MRSQTSSTDERAEVSIAVDFGGTKTAAARISRGKIEDRCQVATDGQGSPQDHIDSIVKLIEQLIVDEPVDIGVAVSGRIDRCGGWHAVNDNTLKGLASFPLRATLEKTLGRPVNVMNDAVAAAWGEYNCLPDDQACESLLYLTVSTGVGGGIVLNGAPLISELGLAGHVGFMSSRFGDAKCGSGRTGTLESVASGTAIGQIASTNRGQAMGGVDVYQAHLAGEDDATAIIDISALAIATAIADIRTLLEIQVVSIGGSVGLAEGYIDRVRHHLDEEPELFRPRVMAARLGNDAALFGVTSRVGNTAN